jgi:hypothetical protein
MQFKQYQKNFFKNLKIFSKIAKVSKLSADKMNVRVKETLITEEVLR